MKDQLMKHKTCELEGALLDAAVAIAEGKMVLETAFGTCWLTDKTPYEASTSWVIAGPIIERERIHLTPYAKQETWSASVLGGTGYGEGETPLIAAMRAYVDLKFGDEVEL
jgi:hypothetical protein